jgi:hypothetical protein
MWTRNTVGLVLDNAREAAFLEPVAQPGERSIPAQRGVDGVAGDGEAGTGDIFVGQIRKCLSCPEHQKRRKES